MKISVVNCALLALLLTGSAAAQSGIEPPVAETKPEPEYPPELKQFLIEPAKVEVVIDAKGVPFSLSSGTSLPDSVVQALSKWRFRPARQNGKPVPVTIAVTVPLHRPVEDTGRLRRIWRPSKDWTDIFAAAKALDEATATRLEDSIATDSNQAAHLKLLARAVANGGPDTDKVRLREVLWLAQNNMKDEVLGAPFAGSKPAAAVEAYEQIEKVWLDALAANPDDSVILDHATNFLRFSNPALAEKALIRAINATDQASVLLGDLYGLSALGVTAVDPLTGRATAFQGSTEMQPPAANFARRSRATLMASNDLRLLFAGLNTVSSATRSLAAAGGVPAGYADFCGELLAHAKSLYPEAAGCDVTLPEPPATTPWLRIGGNVQQAMLVKQPRPVYPQAAKSRGITGTVRFQALISKEGKIQRLELIAGPLILYQSARDSVSRWEYKPTTLNGNPVEVLTTLDVNYTLSR